MNTFITLIASLLMLYLSVSVAYLLCFALLALFPSRKRLPATHIFRKVALFIPAYKEDLVIHSVVEAALKQNYPASLFEVIVIADSLQANTLEKLRSMPIRLEEVSFQQSTKSRALNKALDRMAGLQFDMALILDADNIIPPDFLARMHQAFDLGAIAIQGHRVAKNKENSYAILDALSEEINNAIFSKGQRMVGLSSRLAGSGMAFEYSLFVGVMRTIDAIGGFDKELELKLIESGVEIEYLPEALIYDEKVSKPEVLSKQRSRWIAAQYHYARRHFPDAFIKLITKGKVDYFNKAFQMILPPRLLLPGILAILSLVFLVFENSAWALWSGCLLVANIASNLLATPLTFYNKSLLTSLLRLPYTFLIMCGAMIHIGTANKKFIHTPHTNISVHP